MKKIIQLKLKFIAKLVLARYKPDVIGVTGSVGKTSSKEAIVKVLSKKFNVRGSSKNYNNEIGLPLAILGYDSPGKSIIGWIGVFLKATKLLIWQDKNFPKILVLEMGVDRPGDMKYLTSIIKAKIGVVTRIGYSHLEYFGTIEKIQKEKAMLIEDLESNGWAILNYDDDRSKKISHNSRSKVLTYGFKEGADVRARELKFSFEESKEVDNLIGVSFKLTYQGSTVPVLLPNVVGYAAIYAALSAAAVAVAYGMNLVDVSEALRNFNSPRGRMNLIQGIKNSLIIDDSYNSSSPEGVYSALDWMEKIHIKKGARKLAILGDMLELGGYSEQGHKEVGGYLVKKGINKLITVGERSRDIGRGAEDVGMKKDDIFNFDNSDETRKFVEDRIREGDLILVKGSQGMRMEKIVKEIMADPMKAEYLLVRQEPEWLEK